MATQGFAPRGSYRMNEQDASRCDKNFEEETYMSYADSEEHVEMTAEEINDILGNVTPAPKTLGQGQEIQGQVNAGYVDDEMPSYVPIRRQRITFQVRSSLHRNLTKVHYMS